MKCKEEENVLDDVDHIKIAKPFADLWHKWAASSFRHYVKTFRVDIVSKLLNVASNQFGNATVTIGIIRCVVRHTSDEFRPLKHTCVQLRKVIWQ